ncbi:MAG: rRNA maturation RNase YbeY [Tunicatimonas sp.]
MIRFFSEDVDFSPSNESQLIRWLNSVAQDEQTEIAELSYIFCSDDYLLALNQQYLNHDFYTDVITFDHREQVSEPIVGDVFISYDRVIDNSQQLCLNESDELNRVVLHGLLHLLGYGDTTSEEKDDMRLLEDKYLNNLRET